MDLRDTLGEIREKDENLKRLYELLDKVNDSEKAREELDRWLDHRGLTWGYFSGLTSEATKDVSDLLDEFLDLVDNDDLDGMVEKAKEIADFLKKS